MVPSRLDATTRQGRSRALQEIGQEIPVIGQGHQEAPDPLHDQKTAAHGLPMAPPRGEDAFRFDLDSRQTGRQVRRKGRTKPVTLLQNPHLRSRQGSHLKAVASLLRSRGDRFPVGHTHAAGPTGQENGGNDRLANFGPRSSDHDLHHTVSSASARALYNRSNCWSVWLECTEIRSRAVPDGTVGGRSALTSSPCPRSRWATARAR